MSLPAIGPRKDGGVVDPKLKVYGTSNVFVVDASVIPVEPAAHLQVSCTLVGVMSAISDTLPLQGTVYAFAEHAAEIFKS